MNSNHIPSLFNTLKKLRNFRISSLSIQVEKYFFFKFLIISSNCHLICAFKGVVKQTININARLRVWSLHVVLYYKILNQALISKYDLNYMGPLKAESRLVKIVYF